MRSRFLLVGSALLASVLLLASGPAAVAGGRSHKGAPYKVKDLRVISGPSPFEGGCPGARFDDMWPSPVMSWSR
jgi:hypothetical protein